MFLMLRQKEKNPDKIEFLKSKEGTVSTSVESKLSGFLQQRMRWGSKSRYYKDRDVIILGLLVWIVNFLLILFSVLSFYSIGFIGLLLGLWIIKSGSEILLLCTVTKYYGMMGLLKYFLPLSLLYPFYINAISFLILLKPAFTWKDRKYRTHL